MVATAKNVRRCEGRKRDPEQPEILRYLEFIADQLDLGRSLRFDARVESANGSRPPSPRR